MSGSTPRPVAAVPAGAVDALVERHVEGDGARWWRAARSELARSPARFGVTFATVARQLGRRIVRIDPDEAKRLGDDACVVLERRSVDEVARIAMLLGAADRLPEADFAALVDATSAHGDTGERQAVVRALPLVPGPDRFVALALEACRTSVLPLFEAIACENPYPAAFFPARGFEHMVLKALFLGVGIDRIVGLGDRQTGELRRMAFDCASERIAARRPVPPDVWRLVEPDGVAWSVAGEEERSA